MCDLRVTKRAIKILDRWFEMSRSLALQLCRRARHHRYDIVAALLESAAHLDRLVGADAAGDAERD